MDIKNKVIIITGASMGIGKAAAELLYAEGAKLALVSRSVDLINEFASKMTDSYVLQVDLSKPEDATKMIEDVYKHYGKIDVLINNAAQGYRAPVELVDLEDYKYIMALNVYSPLMAMQAVIPIMKRQGGGTIVNISSNVSKNTFPTLAAYASTKTALNMLSLTARKELADDNIIVSIVHPGLTATDFGKNSIKSKIEHKQMLWNMPVADPAEKVAERILKIILSGDAEEHLVE